MNQRTYLGTTYLDVAKGAVEVFMKSVLGGFPPPPTGGEKRPFLLLLRVPADPEPHCLRPSSRHFAFVSRKVSGVEMEAERFIIARDVVQCLDWSRNPPIILNSAPSHHPRIPIGQSVLKVDKPPLFIVFIYFYAGWKENHATFMCELKNLQASGLTTLGHALRTAFDLLNLNRLVSGIDNYGQGRNPFFLEPSVIITITDGNKLTHSSGVPDELHLPLNSPLAGSELTKEPFRWDQRLFALVLRLPGATTPDNEQLGSVPTDESAITQMCEVTGGRSYCVRTQRMLNQCLESLVQKVQSGVVINFEKTGPDPPLIGEDNSVELSRPVSAFSPQLWHSCHKLIYVRPNPKTGVPVGHWPIPESFWPDQNSPTLINLSNNVLTSQPPRTAHPVVRFSCVDCEPMVIDKLPFDKYELEPSPLTQYILERKSPHMCWQVRCLLAAAAKQNDLGQPFGYLKASTTLTCVNLFVMPYNYPVLLPLLGKDGIRSPDRVCGEEGSPRNWHKGEEPLQLSLSGAPPGLQAVAAGNHRRGAPPPGGHQLQRVRRFPDRPAKQAYRNAYDIPRRNLLDQLTRMRSNLLRTSQKLIRGQDEDYLHSIPVAQMGNYQEYLKMMPSPLREIDPDQPKRLHTFGNPFKQDKKGMMIDEADEFVAGPQNKKRGNSGDPNSGATMKRRRSMSPLLRRPQTPPGSPNHCCGVDGNNVVVTESNGDGVLGPEPVEIWPAELDTVAGTPSALSLEEKDGMVAADQGEDINMVEERLVEDHLDEQQLEEKLNCDRLSPQSQMECADVDADPAALETIFIPPLDGSQAELRSRVIKEVRKPGRSESELVEYIASHSFAELGVILRTLWLCFSFSDYEAILRLLQQVKGPVNVQKYFIQHAIKEAVRLTHINLPWFVFWTLGLNPPLLLPNLLRLRQVQEASADPAAGDGARRGGGEARGILTASQRSRQLVTKPSTDKKKTEARLV
ncbi:Integrator complex subunit 6 [Collichthys lucidus]|uniref:Integrator complex subunit 6 n=1 Tax=Collichthys lucidus TaxID=240159 RepID=A0A4U5UF34_COLLU|nr:Integrator complex subunit 6 [Collichthys lucidus]